MLRKIKGDIWSFDSSFVVIPTNLEGVCGRGLAAQMVAKNPSIGSALREQGKSGNLVRIYDDSSMGLHVFCDTQILTRFIVIFPVKRCWRDEADLSMICKSAERLKVLLQNTSSVLVRNPFYCIMPYVGCGFGELTPEVVMPVLEPILEPVSNRVLMIEPDPDVFNRYKSSFKPGYRSDKSAVNANLPPSL